MFDEGVVPINLWDWNNIQVLSNIIKFTSAISVFVIKLLFQHLPKPVVRSIVVDHGNYRLRDAGGFKFFHFFFIIFNKLF